MLDKPYVIHHRRPYQCLFLIVLALAITVTAIWYWNQHWRQQQTENLTALQSQHQQLMAENQRLTESNQTLMAELENINQMQAMQRASDSQLQTELQSLQEQLIELNKELLFYQNITQGNASSKLQVRDLHLRSVADDPTLYNYRIVLTQGKKITKAVLGSVELSLTVKSGEMMSSRLISEQALNIRHVQVLEGMLKLTENEQPISLQVTLKQKTKTLAERTFEWDATPSP